MLEAEHILVDIAGGLTFTMPSEKDLRHPVLGNYLNKYFRGADNVSAEDRMRMFRLIQIMATEPRAHAYICAGGSPQPHRIFIYRNIDLEGKKKLAKDLAGIEK
jgi:4-hydroxybutyryl-CoA dehydratase/vinylacetyl-CoA-Delta-isomerase